MLTGGTLTPTAQGDRRESGPRTPALPSTPAPSKGDPAPKRAANVVRTVNERGEQHERGDRPTKAIYRNGVKIS